MKCKVFVEYTLGLEKKELFEKKINVWLRDNNVEITNVAQTEIGDGFVCLTIFYKG